MLHRSRFSSAHPDDPFQLLVDSVTDYAIYMLDLDGRVATWNAGARRFKGYAASEIIGQHFSVFFTEDDCAAGLPEKALRTAADEGRFEGEGWRVRKDGTRYYVHAIIDPIKGDDGNLIGFAKITRDVTEQKAKERALHESEERFRLLVQGVRDYAIFMLDREGRITNWNAGAEAIKGYSEEEIVGQHFSIFYTEKDRAAGEPARALETALREGKYEREALRVRKGGEPFWANVVIDPIYNDRGEHVGFGKVTRDITERKRAEDELEEARTSLFQAQKLQALGELTGGIAHDFNNMLTVICGSVDLLQRGDLSEERRKRYLAALKETAGRAATLTEHLLAFSRRQAIRPEVVDLNLRMDALAEVLDRTLGSRIEVRLELGPDLWPVSVDPAQLETAVLNAAFNGRDAMPDGGCLTISTSNVSGRNEEMVCLSIADTGTGMSEKVISRVFEPFFTTKPVGKGTGLGLSQIHGFAAQAGGRAEIRSKEGEGTTIRILLPRSSQGPAPRDDEIREARTAVGAVVLLVEDNDQVRDFARHLLEDIECKVLSASDGDEALAILDAEEIDLLFTDVVMPGRSGLELARIARARSPSLPILLATGYSEEIVGGGATEFELLRKPYSAKSLGEAIAEVLGAGKAGQS